jgi:hypothetical protein
MSQRANYYFIDPAQQEQNKEFLKRIREGLFLMLLGARASGKTTRLLRLKLLLEADFVCILCVFLAHTCTPANVLIRNHPTLISVSCESLMYRDDRRTFWRSIHSAIQTNFFDISLKPVNSSRDFLDVFSSNAWSARKVIFIVDEFSELLRADKELQNDVLRTFREIKNNRDMYAIHSVVICGTFSLLHLSATETSISPFNVADYLQSPYFSKEETQRLFHDFARDRRITIEGAVIEDIWFKSNGYLQLKPH